MKYVPKCTYLLHTSCYADAHARPSLAYIMNRTHLHDVLGDLDVDAAAGDDVEMMLMNMLVIVSILI